MADQPLTYSRPATDLLPDLPIEPSGSYDKVVRVSTHVCPWPAYFLLHSRTRNTQTHMYMHKHPTLTLMHIKVASSAQAILHIIHVSLQQQGAARAHLGPLVTHGQFFSIAACLLLVLIIVYGHLRSAAVRKQESPASKDLPLARVCQQQGLPICKDHSKVTG